MNRRGFLELLSASAAGLLLAPAAPLVEAVAPAAAPAVAPAALATDSFRWLIDDTLRELNRQLALPVLPHGFERTTEEMVVGSGVRQFHVQLVDFEHAQRMQKMTPEDMHRAFVLPAATAMAQSIRHAGIRQFGELQLPLAHPDIERMHRITSMETGLSLRGLRVYDPPDRMFTTRIDVIGRAA